MSRRLNPYLMSVSQAEELVRSATPDAAAAAARLAMRPLAAWKLLPIVRRALDLTRVGEMAAAQRSWVRRPRQSPPTRHVPPTQWEQLQ